MKDKYINRKVIIRFCGFYPYRPIIIGEITKEDFQKNPSLLRQDCQKFEYEGYSLRIARDSMILLRIDSIEKERKAIDESWEGDLTMAKSYDGPWNQYLKHLNVLYFLLECVMHYPGKRNISLFDYSEIDRNDLRRITYDDKDIAISQTTYGHKINFDNNRYGKVNFEELPKSQNFDIDIFKDLAKLYQYTWSNELIEKVYSVSKSLSYFKVRDFDSCLLLSWILLEIQITWLWDNLISKKGITGDRKKRMKGRDYTVSIILDHLEMHGELTKQVYEDLNVIRQARNDLVHEGQVSEKRLPIMDIYISALKILQDFYYQRYKIRMSYSIHPQGSHGL